MPHWIIPDTDVGLDVLGVVLVRLQLFSQGIFDYIELTEDHSIFETAVPASWVGKTIVELAVRQKYHINVLATKQAGKLEPLPGPAHCFKADETIFILGRTGTRSGF